MSKRTETRDKTGKAEQLTNGETLRAAVTWAFHDQLFCGLRFHGNTKWDPVNLIMLAVVWVWSNEISLTVAFQEARRWCLNVLGGVAVQTYQWLLKALTTWTKPWLPLIWDRLHGLMQKYGGKCWRVGRYVAIAVDGSRVSVPRTEENESIPCTELWRWSQERAEEESEGEGDSSVGGEDRTAASADMADVAMAHGIAHAMELEDRTIAFIGTPSLSGDAE